MTNRVAIDFGTTRTKVAYRVAGREPELLRFGGHRYLPYAASIFYLPKDGGPVLFGDDAERMQETDPAGVIDVPKRRRHNETVRAGNGRALPFADLLRAMFTQLREKATREIPAFKGKAPTGVNLTVPVGFGPADRDLWERSAKAAGFEDVAMIEEPSAAALGWVAVGGSLDEGVIVLDCGGGTVDWAWLRMNPSGQPCFETIPPEGIVDLGGHDIDLGLLELVESLLLDRGVGSLEFGTSRRTRLLRRLRDVKEAIGRGEDPEPLTIDGTEILLTRDQVMDEIRARFVANAVGAFQRFLRRVAAAQDDQLPPVLLVGGSGRLRGIQDAVEAAGAEVVDWTGAEFAPVLGAASWNAAAVEESAAETRTGFRANGDSEQAEAAFVRGCDLALGNGVLRDLTAATHCYREAAEQGHRVAAFRLLTMTDAVRLLDPTLELSLEPVVQPFVEALAERGNSWTNIQLSKWHLYGAGTLSADKSLSVAYAKAAAESRCPYALVHLGTHHDYENGDHKIELLREAAEAGNSLAEYEIAHKLWWYRDSESNNDHEIFSFAERAALNGQVDAMILLGTIYSRGKVVPRSREQAMYWLERACAERCDSEAMYDMRWIDCRDEDLDNRIEKILQDCRQKDLEAMFLVGSSAISGWPYFAKDEETGLSLIQESANRGYKWSQLKLARLFFDGEAGLTRSHSQAMSWARRAAEQGDRYSQTWFGCMCLSSGSQADKAEGITWLHRAAERGDADAQFFLGVALAHGVGIEARAEEGLEWVKRSSNKPDKYGYAGTARKVLGMLKDVG